MESCDLDALAELERKATDGPWKWGSVDGCPQIEGSVYAAEMNPVLVARGCGNKLKSSAGVEGCMPSKLDDPLRACPLHPDKPDRELIVSLRNHARTLIAEAKRARELEAALKNTDHTPACKYHQEIGGMPCVCGKALLRREDERG